MNQCSESEEQHGHAASVLILKEPSQDVRELARAFGAVAWTVSVQRVKGTS